ncbi:glutathione hydrolase 6 isoform X2 [Megalops cyprinoides]|nr:glutathione hydrolase 6 isoform X2 [Megalops cyprinoides]
MALGFVICERYGCLSEGDSLRSHTAATGPSETDKSQEEHTHHHGGHQESGEEHDHHGNPDHHQHQHSNSLYHHGVVISDSVTCSGVGKEILEDGGNSVDAGIATLLCLGVVHPHTAGVGGVFSGIHYNRTSGTYKGFHSTFPKASSAAYGIPATLQGVKQLHSQFGHLKWEKLFTGATRLAKEGFLVDGSLARALKSNQARIIQSSLCDLFCDRKDTIKALGSRVTNQKLSELLHDVSLNDHFLENLATKLAEDLPQTERQDFVENVQQCRGEINDALVVEKQEYTIFTAASPLSSRIISDLLQRAREQNLPPWSNTDLNSSASTYINLLSTARLIYNNSLALESQRLEGLFTLKTAGSHIGVLDSAGNVLIISTSLNSSFGSMQLFPSTGVILSDFFSHPTDSALLWSCPLVLKLKHDDDGDDGEDGGDEEEEVLAIGVVGGLSAPFAAAQIILNKMNNGKSPLESVASPLLHFETGSPDSFSGCVSGVSNGTDVYRQLLEREEQMQSVEQCSDTTLALILQSHAGHVGAYGAPVANAYTDGY